MASKNVYGLIKYNPNPKEKKTSDGVIRALCKVTGKNWDSIYLELLKRGFELKVMPDDDKVWKEYLDSEGFVYHSIPIAKVDKRPRVEAFLKEHPTGTYILKVAGTILACVNGHYYTMYDYNDSAIYGYYEKSSKQF